MKITEKLFTMVTFIIVIILYAIHFFQAPMCVVNKIVLKIIKKRMLYVYLHEIVYMKKTGSVLECVVDNFFP